MIVNYLRIALRNLRKHLTYSVINIAGLGLGLATCMLLVIWISHELSYDEFHDKSDRLYRSSLEYGFGGQVAQTPVSPTALLPALLSFPETETGVRVGNPSAWNPFIVRVNDKLFQETRFYFADSTFFDVFSYELIKGNPKTALVDPYNVVLTESMARKYFGDEDPVGKTLTVGDSREYAITGVMQDVPDNSFLQFDFLGSFNSLRAGRAEPIWWTANYQTFVVLNESASLKTVEQKINEHVKKILADELTGEGDYVRYNFTLLTDLHLRSSIDSEFEVVGDIKYVYIFSAIALLVLVIAITNYINLATARATERAKEVSLRKVVGAERAQLFFQFIGESLIVTLLSFATAFLISYTLLPFFNNLTGKHFDISWMVQPTFIGYAVTAVLVISLLSGAYPALVITAFKPATVLKGSFKYSGKGIWLRRSLVVFQFCISMVLIVGTLVILKQLDFIQNKKLGYDKNNTIILPYDDASVGKFDALKTELEREGIDAYVARAAESPVNIRGGYGVKKSGDDSQGTITTGLPMDEGYIPAFNMKIIEGRNFNRADFDAVETDTVYAFVVNETALKVLGIKQDEAIGTKIELAPRKGEIVGVVEDFHFATLHSNIDPLVMFPESAQFNYMFIKFTNGDIRERIAQTKGIYNRVITHRPFEYEFVDQEYAALYQGEQRMGSIFTVFAILAIFIACLGLLGLVSFSAAQRTKEIGIRKVLGATSTNIVLLITRDYAKLIIVAIVIGLPIAVWMMTRWLSDFAYKTDIGVWPLLAAPLLSIAIAFLTASFQAIKAAMLNPTQTLRNE